MSPVGSDYQGPTTPKGHPRKRMCHHCRQRKTYPMFRRASKGISPICQECEKEGWKFCRLCKQAKLAQDFPVTAEGKTKAHCWACTRNRSGTRSPKKVRRMVTDADEKFILKIWEETHNKMEVARRSGFARNTVIAALNRIHSDPAIMAAKWTPPDPRPYEELSDDAKRGLEDPLFFASHFHIVDEPLEPWARELIHTLYEAYQSDQDEWLVVNAAFGSGKSTVMFVFVCWVICRERAVGREPTILWGHYAEGRAKWYLSQLKLAFSHNRELIDAYGRFRPENKGATVWSSTEILVEPLDWSKLRKREPTVALGSYKGAVMGGHYEICIWDDLVVRENSASADQRQNLAEWFGQTAESRPRTGGLMVLCGARYGPQDLYWNRLQKQYEDDLDDAGRPKRVWRRVIYKAHYPDLCDGKHRGPYPDGCLLSPRWVPWGRIRYAAQDETNFALSYQQEDIDVVGALADPVWFDGGVDARGVKVNGCFDRSLMFGQLRPGPAPVLSAVTVDPAATSFWAVMHWLVYQDGTQQLFRAVRRPLMSPELLYRERDGRFTGLLEDWWDAAKESPARYRYLIVEARDKQRWLAQPEYVQTWLQIRNVALLAHDTNRVNKHDINRGLEMLKPVYREARAQIPYFGAEERYIADVLKREATSYPEGDTSDLLMGHWFLTHNLPNLLGMSEDEPDEDIHRPTWAEVKRPEFANNVMAGR